MRRFDLLQQLLVTDVFDLTQLPTEGNGCRLGGGGRQVKDMRDRDLL